MRGKAKKLYAAIGLALAAMLVASTAAIAAVDFNPETGTGFVGKGDVQLAFGWNNKQLQTNASGVSFTYEASETYDVTVEFDTGNPDNPKSINHHTATQDKSTTVNSSIAYEPRTKNQITGFNLTGLGSTTTTGDQIPQVGDSCNNGFNCVVTNVQLASSTGGLYVSWNGTKVPLQ